MGRTVVNDELIIKMNELYLLIKTYSGVSKALGGSPAPSTVKKYIIPNYKPKAQVQLTKVTWENVAKVENIKLKYKDFGDLCELSPLENKEIEKLWEELSI